MSDINISGIPNYGFAGGGGGYFGGIPNQQPAMSADQINQSMWGRYSPGQAQNTLANIYGPGGFGAQPAYYAGLGAAYGRQTGGFGGYGAKNADPFTPVGGGGGGGDRLPGQSAPGTPVSQWTPADWQQYNSMYSPGAVSRGPDLQAPSTGSYNPLTGSYGSPQSQAPAAPSGGGGGGGDRLPGQSPPGTPVSQWTPADWQQYNQKFGGAAGAGANEGQGGGGGGIGSDALRDQFAWTLARSSPYATPQHAPSSPNIGNLGYNPGMQNWFANPGMNANPFQNRFGLGFGGQAPTMRPDYSSNPLTSWDIYGNGPHSIPGGGFRMDQQ